MNKVKSQYPCWNLTSSYFCLDFKVIKCCRGWVILNRNLLLRWSGDLFFFQDFAIGIPFVCLIIFKKNKGFVEMTKFYKQNLKRPKQRRKFHKQDMKSKKNLKSPNLNSSIVWWLKVSESWKKNWCSQLFQNMNKASQY